MINLLSLLVAAALVSLQCGFEANAEIENSKLDLENNVERNVVPKPKRRLRKFVHIQVPPPDTIRHIVGTQAEIACEVMGMPVPSVHWLRNGEPMEEYEDITEVVPPAATSLARVTSTVILTSSVSGDVYTCVAIAGLKKETASTTVYTVEGDENEELIALQKLFNVASKPRITLFYEEILQDIGTDVILPCRVYTNNKAQIYWTDNHNNIVYGDSRIQVLPSGDLLIASLRWSDLGNYTCTVKNMYGKESATTFLYPTKMDKQ